MDNIQFWNQNRKKTPKMVKQAHFEGFQINLEFMPRVVFDEKSKTGLCVEIGQRQQNVSVCKPSLQLLANPAVLSVCPGLILSFCKSP